MCLGWLAVSSLIALGHWWDSLKKLLVLLKTSLEIKCLVLRAKPGLIILCGPNLGLHTQDPGPYFISARSCPRSSKAAAMSVLRPASLLTLARLGAQLVAPQKCQRLLVSLLLVPVLPRTLTPEVSTVPWFPIPWEHLVTADLGCYTSCLKISLFCSYFKITL